VSAAQGIVLTAAALISAVMLAVPPYIIRITNDDGRLVRVPEFVLAHAVVYHPMWNEPGVREFLNPTRDLRELMVRFRVLRDHERLWMQLGAVGLIAVGCFIAAPRKR